MVDEIDPPDGLDSVDELEGYLADLADAHNALVREVERIDRLVVNGLNSKNDGLDELETLRGEVDRLRDQVEIVDATMAKPQQSKVQKIRATLQWAMTHGSGGPAGVVVETGQASAAASCSRKTARRLMDEIGSSFRWADVETPGGPNPKQLRLAIRDRGMDDLMDDVRAHYGGAEA